MSRRSVSVVLLLFLGFLLMGCLEDFGCLRSPGGGGGTPAETAAPKPAGRLDEFYLVLNFTGDNPTYTGVGIYTATIPHRIKGANTLNGEVRWPVHVPMPADTGWGHEGEQSASIAGTYDEKTGAVEAEVTFKYDVLLLDSKGNESAIVQDMKGVLKGTLAEDGTFAGTLTGSSKMVQSWVEPPGKPDVTEANISWQVTGGAVTQPPPGSKL